MCVLPNLMGASSVSSGRARDYHSGVASSEDETGVIIHGPGLSSPGVNIRKSMLDRATHPGRVSI